MPPSIRHCHCHKNGETRIKMGKAESMPRTATLPHALVPPPVIPPFIPTAIPPAIPTAITAARRAADVAAPTAVTAAAVTSAARQSPLHDSRREIACLRQGCQADTPRRDGSTRPAHARGWRRADTAGTRPAAHDSCKA